MAKDNQQKIQEFFLKHLHTADALINEEKKVIKLSPRLQELTGGIQMGSLILMSGKQKSGKTTTALHIAAKAQQQLGSKVYFYDAECRLQGRDLTGCHDLDRSPEHFGAIYPEPGETMYAEDYLNCIINNVKTEDNLVIILDSVSAMAAKDLEADDPTRRYRDPIPNMLSNFTKVIASSFRKNIILILIVHEIADVNPRTYTTWQQSGGNKIQFANNYNIRVSHWNEWVENDKAIGQINHWHCLNTVTGTKGRSVESKFRYNYGVDEVAELLEVACELFLVKKKGGGWYEYNGENMPRTEAGAIQHLNDNPALFQEILGKVQEIY